MCWDMRWWKGKVPVFTCVICALYALSLLSPIRTHMTSYRLNEVRLRLNEVTVIIFIVFSEKTGSE